MAAPTIPAVVDVWANLASGSPDIATPTYIDTGFPLVSGIPVIPPRGYFNWLFNYCTNGVRYLASRGVTDWNSLETQYLAGAVVRSYDGNWYRLFGTATVTAPHLDPTNWYPLTWMDRSPVSSYSVPANTWRDPAGNARTMIDHWGRIRDANLCWTEDWTPVSAFNAASGPGTFAAGRWSIVIANVSTTGGQSVSFPPGGTFGNPPYPVYISGLSVPTRYRSLVLRIDGSAGTNRIEARLADDYVTSTFADDTLTSVEFDANPYEVLDTNWVLGFTSQSQAVNAISDGVFFIRPNTPGTNWLCRSITGGVSTQVDSGVLGSAGVNHHFEIVLIGRSNDESTTARALFFIDGVQVANITTNLPVNTGHYMIPIMGGTATTLVADPIMTIGPVKYSQVTSTRTPIG